MGFGVYGFGVLTFRTGQGRACSGILNRKADAATNLNRHRPLHNSTLNPKPYSILLVPKTIQTRKCNPGRSGIEHTQVTIGFGVEGFRVSGAPRFTSKGVSEMTDHKISQHKGFL